MGRAKEAVWQLNVSSQLGITRRAMVFLEDIQPGGGRQPSKGSIGNGVPATGNHQQSFTMLIEWRAIIVAR